MSITDAFRLLNSNIRGISEDRRRHEQEMQALDNKQAMVEAELNSPERKLKRQQAADQLKLTEVKGFGWSPDGKSAFEIETFNDDVLPSLKKAVPEDAELNNKGNLVWAGTDEPYLTESWKAKKIQSELGVAFAMSGLPDKALDREIKKLEFNISELDGKSKPKTGALTGKPAIDKMKWNARLTKLRADRDNPDRYASKLMSSNKSLMDNLDVLYQIDGSPEMIKNLQSRIKNNNQMLTAMSKEGTFKGKEFSYALTEGGKTRTQKMYFKPGMEPQSINIGGKEWKKGAVKQDPGMTDKGKLSISGQNATINHWLKMHSVLSAAKIRKDWDATITRLVAGGHTGEEAEVMANALRSNAKDQVEKYTDSIENYKRRFYGMEFSKGVMWNEGDPPPIGAQKPSPKQTDKARLNKKATKTEGKTKDFSPLWSKGN